MEDPRPGRSFQALDLRNSPTAHEGAILNLGARTLLPALFIAVGGCGGGGAEESVGDACVVLSSEPVVQITSAIDAVNRQPLEQVTLTNFRMNGKPVAPAVVMTPSTGVTLAGSSLRCTLPCGFGGGDATFGFTVEAGGYTPTPVTVEARYANFDGGCPAYTSGGTKISVTLAPI